MSVFHCFLPRGLGRFIAQIGMLLIARCSRPGASRAVTSAVFALGRKLPGRASWVGHGREGGTAADLPSIALTDYNP